MAKGALASSDSGIGEDGRCALYGRLQYPLSDMTGTGPVFFKVRGSGNNGVPYCVGNENALFTTLIMEVFFTV
jgi:hypothetical protein